MPFILSRLVNRHLQPPITLIHPHRRAGLHVTAHGQVGERIFQLPSCRPLQSPRAVDRVVRDQPQPQSHSFGYVQRVLRSAGSSPIRDLDIEVRRHLTSALEWKKMISARPSRKSGRKSPRMISRSISLLLKSTVGPCPLVRRPSSSTCDRMLNRSPCAFSTSSERLRRAPWSVPACRRWSDRTGTFKRIIRFL